MRSAVGWPSAWNSQSRSSAGAGLLGRQVLRHRRGRRNIRSDPLGTLRPGLDLGSHVHEEGDPVGRERRGLSLELLQLDSHLIRRLPTPAILRRLPLPLLFGERLVLQEQIDQAARLFHMPVRLAGGQEFVEIDARGFGKPAILGGKVGLDPDRHGGRQFRVQDQPLFDQPLAALHQRAGERLAALVHRADVADQFLGRLFDQFHALAIELGDLHRRQRTGVNPQIVQAALKTLAAVGRPDAAGGGSARPNRAGAFQAADLVSVQIHAHPAAVERGRAVVPAAVPHPLRRDLGIAFDVPADVQAQRQDRAVVLEREQHPVVAVLLAEDLAIAAQVGRLGPGAEGDARGVRQRNLLADAQQMIARQAQGVPEQAAAADQGRRGRRHLGLPAVGAGVRALVPGDFVETPVGNQRHVDRGGCHRRLRAPRPRHHRPPPGESPPPHRQTSEFSPDASHDLLQQTGLVLSLLPVESTVV